tara:strand:+ start:555 stop:1031 length:477 start_codon:yes stop_codon:yes gene_type:complete
MDTSPTTPPTEPTAAPTAPKTLTQDDTGPNIFDQISAYNVTQTDVFIQQLRDELEDQRQINTILKQADYESNTKEIETFLEDHSETIPHQLKTIESLFADLKSLYEENKELHAEQEQYTQTLDSTKTTKVASDMRQLKTMKNDILAFLYQTGIRAQKN